MSRKSWKKYGQNLLVGALILSVPAAPVALADSSGGMNLSCDQACSMYQNATSESQLAQACGSKVARPSGTPSPDASQQVVTNQQTFDSYDSCQQDMKAKWGQLGQHCDSMVGNQTAQDAEEVAAIAYTVATGVCLVSCLYQASKGIGLGEALQTACLVVGVGAVLVDIGEMINQACSAQKDVAPWIGDAAGTASGVVGIITEVAQTAVQKVTTDIAKDMSNECVSTALFGIAAGLKWGDWAVAKGNKDDECKKVKQFASIAAEFKTGNGTTALPPPSNSGGPRGGPAAPDGGRGNGGVKGGQSLSGGSGGGGGPVLPDKFDANSPMFSQAIANDKSPFGQVLRKLDPNKLNDAAAALGLNPAKIGAQLQTQSPAQILSGMDGLPPNAVEALQKMDDVSKVRGMASLSGGIMSGGKGGSATKTASAAPALGFGMKTPGAGGANEIGFDKQKKAAPKFDDNADIWHEGFQGTIFQIVSHKLDKSHDRIQQMEWQTPLNRALVGLPKLNGQGLVERLPTGAGGK